MAKVSKLYCLAMTCAIGGIIGFGYYEHQRSNNPYDKISIIKKCEFDNEMSRRSKYSIGTGTGLLGLMMVIQALRNTKTK